MRKRAVSTQWRSDDGTVECNGAHIVVSTIGRLIEHLYYVDTEQFDVDTIESPASLDLTHLKWLVVDEADRLMHDSRFDWLTEIERAVYESGWSFPNYVEYEPCRRHVCRWLRA